MPDPPRIVRRAASKKPKPKPPTMRGPRPYSERSNIRRVFRKSPSQEARVYLIRTGKNKRVFFRTGIDRTNTIWKYVFHKIFYALYPQYGIKPLSLAVATIDGKQELGMTSEIVRNRSHDYKLFHHTFYTDPIFAGGLPHASFAIKQQDIVEQIKRESGIWVSNHPVNVINQNGKPIFVEIEEINFFSRKKLQHALHEKKVDIQALKENILKNAPPAERTIVEYTLNSLLQA